MHGRKNWVCWKKSGCEQHKRVGGDFQTRASEKKQVRSKIFAWGANCLLHPEMAIQELGLGIIFFWEQRFFLHEL